MMYVWVQGSATMDETLKVKNWLQSVGLSLDPNPHLRSLVASNGEICLKMSPFHIHSRAPWFGGSNLLVIGQMIESFTSPGPKHRICEKRIGDFKHSGGHDQGVGKLQVTSEIFGHQVKTFTLDVTLSEVPLKTIISVWRKDAASSCYRKSMDLDCIHLLMSEPQNSEANVSWNSIQNCFLNKNSMWFFLSHG